MKRRPRIIICTGLYLSIAFRSLDDLKINARTYPLELRTCPADN